MTLLQKGKQQVCAPLACASCGLYPLSSAENLMLSFRRTTTCPTILGEPGTVGNLLPRQW
jgi:hypothetical protein